MGIKGLPFNTVPCCSKCNSEKSNLMPELFLELCKIKLKLTGDPRYRAIIFNLNKILSDEFREKTYIIP